MLVDCFIFCSLLSSRVAVTKTMLVPLRLSAQLVCSRVVTFSFGCGWSSREPVRTPESLGRSSMYPWLRSARFTLQHTASPDPENVRLNGALGVKSDGGGRCAQPLSSAIAIAAAPARTQSTEFTFGSPMAVSVLPSHERRY